MTISTPNLNESSIDELSIPTAPGASGWVDFLAMVDVRNAIETEGFGTTELNFSAEELLPRWQNQVYEPIRLFVARVEGHIVARATYETVPGSSAEFVWFNVQVLASHRRRGIGAALTDQLESIAQAEGRRVHVAYANSREEPGERLRSPTGFGSVPLHNPEVKFLLTRGYSLEQVERGSRLALPLDAELSARHLNDAVKRSGPDYSVDCWIDHTPKRWLDDMAIFHTRMSTDAPSAGLEEPEDVWTVQRVIDEERTFAAGPRTMLTAVAVHGPSGRLAGFTQLSVPAELERQVSQEDTLVLREHRGRKLGMLVKIANLEHLARERPGHPAVTTFNAEENRHMLDVNEAVGFVPMGYEGAWKRVAD